MSLAQDVYIFTFATTTQAMAMDDAAKKYAVPGKLTALPSQIKAGCGFAWQIVFEDYEKAMALIEKHAIAYEKIVQLKI